MELKWLEDFVCLARTRSFSRAAEQRNVTQSAFSRRIRALETWAGASLLDRDTQPVALTAAGRTFLETAEEAVHALYAGREALRTGAAPGAPAVAVAALHTLALGFFPAWIRTIEARTGPLQTRLLPDSFHLCLRALVDGGFDFMLMYHHPHAPIVIDPDLFPHKIVGHDRMVAVRRADADGALPLLGYPEELYLGRMMRFGQDRAGEPDVPLAHVSDSAAALKVMVLEGHGFAWLPGCLVEDDIAGGRLLIVAPDVPLEVRLYRDARRRRPIARAVWEAAEAASAEPSISPRPPPARRR